MMFDNVFKRAKRRRERCVLCHSRSQAREQLRTQLRQDDARHTAVAHHRAARDDQLPDMARLATREQEVERIESNGILRR